MYSIFQARTLKIDAFFENWQWFGKKLKRSNFEVRHDLHRYCQKFRKFYAQGILFSKSERRIINQFYADTLDIRAFSLKLKKQKNSRINWSVEMWNKL